MMPNLKTKHFGEKVRLIHLDADRFQDLSGDFQIPEFGILTRYEDGTVGVSIHIMSEPDAENKRYGIWIQEQTQDMTISAWADSHASPMQTMDIWLD